MIYNRFYFFSIFDDTIDYYDVYKVETIGDAYMVVSGVPSRIEKHATEICLLALDILESAKWFCIPHIPGEHLELRIGIHTGKLQQF